MEEKKAAGMEEKIKESYERWEHLLKCGGQDPFATDGQNMNLVRAHILSYCHEQAESGKAEEGGFSALPPEFPSSYMARSREIWYGAVNSYLTFLKDENYQYLCAIAEELPPKIKKESCIENVLGYVRSVKMALKQKDFVSARRYENPGRCLESFRECRQRIGDQMLKEEKKDGQINLFQYSMADRQGR